MMGNLVGFVIAEFLEPIPDQLHSRYTANIC
jgi:hypothetical protein